MCVVVVEEAEIIKARQPRAESEADKDELSPTYARHVVSGQRTSVCRRCVLLPKCTYTPAQRRCVGEVGGREST